MDRTAKDVLRAILENPTSTAHVGALVAPDATYVSLNFDNPALKRIMPWAGTARGPQAIVQTFKDVGRYWTSEAFEESRVSVTTGMPRCSAA